MFSGIIQSIGNVVSIRPTGGGREVVISPKLKRKFRNGESVMISGICSTVTKTTAGKLTFFYMPETLKKTNAGSWKAGARVNIEPSLKVGDDISGHFVFGHIDGVARIDSIKRLGGSRVIWFTAPKGMGKFLIPKGSVALDGTSLTIVDVKGDRFSVSFIPFTLAHTTIGQKQPGDTINFEADMLAKYISKLVRR